MFPPRRHLWIYVPLAAFSSCLYPLLLETVRDLLANLAGQSVTMRHALSLILRKVLLPSSG